MATEIERKFLVNGLAWRAQCQGEFYRQAYLAIGPATAIRVRIAKGKAILNIKQASDEIARYEFEYPIPLDEAEVLVNHLRLGNVIEKKRYKIPYAGHCWEVDEFFGENEGLLIAEIELSREDETFERPDWLGREVSYERRYFNASLAVYPYAQWNDADRV